MNDKELRHYTETGVSEGAKLTEDKAEFKDLRIMLSVIKKHSTKGTIQWLDEHPDAFAKSTFVIDSGSSSYVNGLAAAKPRLIINKKSLDSIINLDKMLVAINDALPYGGYFWGHSRTSLLKHKLILQRWPGIFGKIVYALHYLWHRVCPKLWVIRWFYFLVTRGKHRSFSRVEILGRMCRAGFEIVDERFCTGEFHVLGRKVKEPRRHRARPYGIIIKLNRIGYKGKRIGVYKFRTMYPYAEYLQPYMMEHEGLRKGGKFKNDYRINFWGRMFRSNMLDELPMILNMFKGQLKLVGVRPLSSAYFDLYTPEMKELRISVKPGLLPPFYYDEKTPETLEEIQESEKRYIEAYKKHPFRTDWRYFWGVVRNVVFKKKRSH